jgi:hypothetical protein
MKINLVEVPVPMVTEFSLCASPSRELLKETKKVRVSPSCHTKTRVYTNMQIGNSRNGINFVIEGFKTFEKREYSFLSGDLQVTNYFLKSKKQNIESYKEYVKKVVEIAIKEYLKVELDEVTIELEVANF